MLRWLDALQQVFAENRQQLTDLDSAVGDGDFGISLDRGFTAVQAELSANPPADLRSVFQNMATVLIKTMGGSSGPLLGTFFLRAGATCADKSELAPADVVALFQAGVEGIQQRGKAERGDKTMLDALASGRGCDARCPGGWRRPDGNPGTGRGGGRSRREATISMQARKGRASYLGERSVGHQDPGAIAVSPAAESRRGRVAVVIGRLVQSAFVAARWSTFRTASEVSNENTSH